MADRIYVHIGAPKSGTTFIQTILWDNKERLAANGILLPGLRRYDHVEMANYVRSSAPSKSSAATWRRIGEQIRSWPGTVILSNEWFTLATGEQVRKFINALRPAEVHVVFTARNFVYTVPAAWQEMLKLGGGQSFEEFYTAFEKSRAGRWGWNTMDASLILPVWTESVPTEQTHIVTVPPRSSGTGLLWERFATVCGLDASAFRTDSAFANESIGAESARLLELIGPEIRHAVEADRGHRASQYKLIRNYFSHSLLAPLGGTKIGVDNEYIARINTRSEATVEKLHDAGYVVEGNLDELRNGDLPESLLPEKVEGEAVLSVALSIIPQLLGRIHQESRKSETEAKKVKELQMQVDQLRGVPNHAPLAARPLIRKALRALARTRRGSRRSGPPTKS
ncbi:hypothetical protein [Arthrobacter monumenti]